MAVGAKRGAFLWGSVGSGLAWFGSRVMSSLGAVRCVSFSYGLVSQSRLVMQRSCQLRKALLGS